MNSNEQRLIQLHSGALSGKNMVAVSLSGSEAISELFSFVVELSSDDAGVDAATVLGEETTLLVKALLSTGQDRYIHGHIAEFISLGMDAGGDARYRAVIVPRLWFLGLAPQVKTHCHEGKKLQDIYKALLAEAKIDYKVLASDASPALNYFQLQYNESDLDFILRFLAEAGVSFYFEHSASAHKMVLVNSATMYATKRGKLRFSASGVSYASSETVLGWRQQYQCFTPSAAHLDYDNKKQEKVSGEEKVTTKIKQMQSLEAKLYANGFADIDPGKQGMPALAAGHAKAQAKVSLRTGQGQYRRINSASNCVSLFAGNIIELEDTPPGGGKKFIVTRIHHSASSGFDTGTDYSNEFECIPDTAEIAPDAPVSQPVYGNLAATVVESEYDVESANRSYGMVKVAFPWDPKTKSPWLQVAQIFGSGGRESGAWFLPQKNDDVLVSFLGGDTRRPVIIGVMHNGKDKGPKFTNGDGDFTRIGIKTPVGHELSFCDSGGKKVKKEVYLESAGNFDRYVKENETVKIDKDNEVDIKGDQKLKIGKGQDVDIKADQKVKVGKKITIEAGTSIELKVGSNKITIDNTGVTIEGMNVSAKAKLEAKIEGLNVTASAKVNAKVDGTMSELSGKAMTTVKGAMVMIN